MSIIGSIVWNPQKPKAGESVKVDVCGPDGKPYDNKESDHIAINGVAGSSQYLQFPLPGDKKVSVTALTADGKQEQSTVTITVAASEPSPETLAIISEHSDLTKDQIAWLKATADVFQLTVAPCKPHDSPYRVKLSLVPLSKFVAQPVSPAASTSPTSKSEATTPPIAKPSIEPKEIGPHAPPAPGTSVEAHTETRDTYSWDFGDGKNATTDSPTAIHDFEDALSTTKEHHQFHIKVTGTRKTYSIGPTTSTKSPDPTSTVDLGSWTRTLYVHNTYVASKKRGHVVLPVKTVGWATKSGKNFVGEAEIRNNEPVPIKFVSRRLIPIHEDSEAKTVLTELEAVEPPIVVPAKGSVKIKVIAPFSHVPSDARGFSAVFSEQPVAAQGVEAAHSGSDSPDGETANPIAGLKVRATAHFQVHPQYWGKVKSSPVVVGAGAGLVPFPADDGMPPIAVGNECDPDNLPENIPEGMHCQCTRETKTVCTSGQFLNARKGDVVLCPSCGDATIIDSMFNLLNPPQLYGHSGIMTRNYDQITHCTASQPRLINYKVGSNGEDGLDPDALKYLWPGVLTETVENAVNGEPINDPSATPPQSYVFQSFQGSPNAIDVGNKFVIIPPVVVKPDPINETTAVRELLTKVADDAQSNTGRFHYRFYCFTNPEAALEGGLAAPKSGLGSSSKWAEGTRAAVCSSFIWLMMKGRGVNALGSSKYATAAELSAAAKQMQVALDPDGKTLDGLFYYSEQQRSVCANSLHDQVYNMAMTQVSSNVPWFLGGGYIPGGAGLAEYFTKAADKYADQVCNAFAVDDCNEPKEDAGLPTTVTQPWSSPGNANAISPENFLAWNGPGPEGSVLGYSEPLIYQPGTVATIDVYKWAHVTEYGKLTGRVYLDGKPAEHVTVQIRGIDKITSTDKDGRYSFDKVPYGPCVVTAKLAWVEGPVVGGVKTGSDITSDKFREGQASIKVDKQEVVVEDIKLKLPDQPFLRTIVIKGYASLDCSVWHWGSHHWDLFQPIEGEVNAGAGVNNPWNQSIIVHSADAEISAYVSWNDDDSVNIYNLQVGLDNPGGRTWGPTSLRIPAGKSQTITIGNSDSFLNGRNGYYYNGSPDLEAKNDTLCCSLTFTNKEWSGS